MRRRQAPDAAARNQDRQGLIVRHQRSANVARPLANILSRFRNRFNCVPYASPRVWSSIYPKGDFAKKMHRWVMSALKRVPILLIPALVALWRIGGIPAAGGRPVGRPGEWIRSARSPYAAHRGPALVGRGIAAIRAAPPIGRAPCTGISDGSG